MPIFNRFFPAHAGKSGSEMLRLLGPVLAVEVAVPEPLAQLLMAQGLPVPAPVAGAALIDTGASMSCVDEIQIGPLGLTVTNKASVCGVAGPADHSVFQARLRCPGEAIDFTTELLGVNLTGQTAGRHPIIALLGRDILAKCVLTYNGPGGFITLGH